MTRSAGTLRYSPKLLGDKESEKWWLVLDCDPDVGRYYRSLYHGHYHGCRKLLRPAWQEHITVIRNEEPPDDNKHLWEKYAGEAIEFEYDPEPRTNGCYWWLGVTCPRLLDVRVELGLPREPSIPLHLSFGHTGEGHDGVSV